MSSVQEKLFINTLRDKNYSVTNTRLNIFRQLLGSEPKTMHELYKECHVFCDRASLYRNIKLLESLGVVQRISIGWKYKVELSDQFTDHHHHITCRRCGTTETLPEEAALEKLIGDLIRGSGYTAAKHQLEISGICAKCRTANSNNQ